MVTLQIAVHAVWLLSIVLGGNPAVGQDYPTRPIRLIASEPGGGADVVARLIAQGVSGPLHASIIVENRPTKIIGEMTAKAAPDGYTILLHSAALWIEPLLVKTQYDPVKDLAPITLLDRAPNVIVVNPSVPAKTVKELIALAKAKPGQLNYGSAGIGSSGHLTGELFKFITGVTMTHIPYKSTGPALNDLIGGHIDVMFLNVAGAMPHVKSGALRALAVASAQTSPLAPGLPTATASGAPGFESESTHSLFAPTGTPRAIISKLNEETVRFITRPDVKAKFFVVGLDAAGSSEEELATWMASEMARLSKVIKGAGIKVD